jgi:hypothetical protein
MLLILEWLYRVVVAALVDLFFFVFVVKATPISTPSDIGRPRKKDAHHVAVRSTRVGLIAVMTVQKGTEMQCGVDSHGAEGVFAEEE